MTQNRARIHRAKLSEVKTARSLQRQVRAIKSHMTSNPAGTQVMTEPEQPLFEFLFSPGEATEIRVVEPFCGTGFFDNATDLADALSQLDAMKPVAVYCSLNPVTRAAFDRSPNCFQRATAGVKLACSVADILRRSWILIDFDPTRPSRTSSTNHEKTLARMKMGLVRDWLLSEGAPPLIEADSANGFHLLMSVNLPNDAASGLLVKGFLAFLSAKFSDDAVTIDRGVWDANRIVKAYGTMGRKGPDTPERPHRRSGIISLPPSTSPCPRELLEKWQLAPLPPAKQPAAISDFAKAAIDKLTEWSEKIPDFPAIQRTKIEGGKVTIIPTACYLNPDHWGSSAGIVVHADNGFGNVCKHSGPEGCFEIPFGEWWSRVEKRFGVPLPLAPATPKAVIGGRPTAAGKQDWTLRNYAAVKVERVRWIFRNYLPCGRPFALVGEPGEGKSLLTVEFAARITTHRGFPEGTEPLIPVGAVLMLNSEDNAGDTIKPRFQMAGGDETKLYQLVLPRGATFNVDNDRDIQRLADQLTAHPDIVCLIIDPILQHVNSEKEQDVRRGVAQLRALVEERGIAFLYAAHFNKVAGKNLASPLDKLSGAKAWSGLPRGVLAAMSGKPDETGAKRHHLILAKSNLGPLNLPTQDFVIEGKTRPGLTVGRDTIPVIRWVGESNVSMMDLLTRPRLPKKKAEEATDEEIGTLLTAELSVDRRPAADIYKVMEDMGIKRYRTERAKALLILNRIMSKPENIAGSWYWRLS